MADVISLAAAVGQVCPYRIDADEAGFAYYATVESARTALEHAAFCSPYPVTLEMAQRRGGTVVWVELETRQGEDGV